MSRFAVIGDPVAHSKSPLMHAAAYRALSLSHTYEALRVAPSDLAGAVCRLKNGEYDGFSVTVPHKVRVLDHVDGIDPSAHVAGAANTLVRAPDGRVVAHNTDAPALADELRALAPTRTPNEWAAGEALVLGTGGAARSALVALAMHLGVKRIRVRGRSVARDFPTFPDPMTVWQYEPWQPIPVCASTVVQATSAGMLGADAGTKKGVCAAEVVAWESLSPGAIALDVVYAPPHTAFLRAATAHAFRATNGSGMLARQGARAFELWLDVPAPLEAMLTALA